MKALLVILLFAGCMPTPQRPPMQWTENGFMPYDRDPLPREQAAYENEARKAMGISKRDWDREVARIAKEGR